MRPGKAIGWTRTNQPETLARKPEDAAAALGWKCLRFNQPPRHTEATEKIANVWLGALGVLGGDWHLVTQFTRGTGLSRVVARSPS